MSYLHKTPFIIQWLFPGLHWRKKPGKKLLYLTFDDGPVPEATPEVLEILRSKGVKATFFCVGDNIKKYPDLFQQIVREGHLVGNHTFNHLNGWKTESETYINNIEKCSQAMEAFNIKSRLFRPPYGRIRRKQILQLKQKKYEMIMWDVLSGDFDNSLPKEQCLKNTIRATSDGSIIVFHDSIKSIKKVREVLPKFIDHFLDQGYNFTTL